WIYLFAGVLTVAAVVATVPLVLIPLLNNLGMNLGTDPDTNRNVAALVLLSTTLLSIFGVRLVAIINNTGVVFEIVGMVVFALILVLFYHHQSVSVFTDTSYLGTSNQTGTFLAAMFMSLFVIYGFDTASTLAEETKNPRREAPRAVIAAVIGAAIIGAIFLFAVVIAIPGDMSKFVADTGAGKYPFPLVTIIEGNFPGWAANLYLFVVFAAIYVSYILGNIAILLARLRGWPREDSPFKLGQWGLVVNILGLVWGLAMEINFLWPRNAAVGGQNPPLSALPNLSISGPISNIPVFEFTLGVILLVGLIYWAIAQRRAPDTSVAPAEAPA